MLSLVIVTALVAVTAGDSGSDLLPQVVTRSRLSQQCAGYCRDSSKFSLRRDSTYVYNYEGTTTSGVVGASNDTSFVKITAKAHIQVSASLCELILQIHDARLLDSSEEGEALRQREFAKTLEANPLRFSYQDGRVEQLCPSVDEPTWALNFKRGLLSAFQNSMVDLSKDAHLYERDVSGSCETTYSVKRMMWSDVRVVKHKNLQTCSGRGLQTLGLPSAFAVKAKSVPIIKSEQSCDQYIKSDDGVYLKNAWCHETHIFAPFSNGQSGIRTTAELTLSLDSIIHSTDELITDLFVNKRTNLQFDFSSTPEDTVNEDTVWDTLKQLEAHNQLGVDKEVPQLFDLLVRQLANLHDQQLVKLFDEQRDKGARKFLLDALPLIGSAGSVKAMHQIYAAREISRDELDSWLTTLAFHKQPTLDMLHTLELFMQEDFNSRVWLAVSSVVHSYCQLDSACAEMPEVQAIMSRLEQPLGQSCSSTTTEQKEAVIVALKSVGNAGFISSLNILKNCFMNEDNPMEVRLAAITATRRFSCSKLVKLPMLSIFQQHSHDTELRIAAYLAAVQCPDTATISRLRDALYQEDTNQVLSFVWTHLTNLQESSSSWKKEIRQMLQDNYLVNKFKTDARKFSRNYEMSAYSDILNTGATVDSNVVFSTKSYLPRSATLNLTLDLFGEAVNIFEVGTRLEGFESVVEDLFSPKGYFPDESMQKMLKNMRSQDNERNEVIQTFSEQFRKGTINEPQGTVFVRIFGNELYLTQFNSLTNLLHLKSPSKYSLKYFMESLSSLFDKNLDYTKSFRFINTEFVVPTVLGLPLRLEVNGTATVGMQMNTKVNLNDILKTKSGNVALSVNPSVAMQIDGKMTVDAVFTQAGVETRGSLSSNTYLDTKVIIERGQIVDVFVNVPRDKVEVFNISSSIYVKHRDRLEEIEGVGEVSEHDSCLGEFVPTISGMRVCSQYTVRNASDVEDSPYFPLTGRFQYALALQKSDNFDSYELHLKQMFESINGKHSGKFVLEVDTPGSQINRKLLADLSYNSKSGEANLELVSPAGSVQFSGKLGLSSADKFLDLQTKLDGQDYATLRLGLQTDNTARIIRYEPSLLLQARPNLHLNITGKLNIVPGYKYSADLTAAGLFREPIAFSADVTSKKGRHSATLSAKAEEVDVKINTRIVNTPTVTSCKTLVRYVLGHSTMQSVDFMGKLLHHKKGGFSKRQLIVRLQTSELPEYNTELDWVLYRTQKYFDSNVDLKLGETQWKSHQLYHNNFQEANKNFELLLSLESPTKNLDYRAELQYKTTDDTIHSHALVQLNEANRFISRVDYQYYYPIHTLELETATPWQRASLEGKLETPPSSDPSWSQMINGNVTLKWGNIANPQRVVASGQYKMKEAPLSTRHAVEARLEREGWENPLLLEGEWSAKTADRLILSDCVVAVTVDRQTYKLAVAYVKDPIQGKHDLKANLELPTNLYYSNVVLIHSEGTTNVTIRLDLEKSLYFTSQLELWSSFDMQLFWNYLEDRSQSVLVQYKTTDKSEEAVVSMPGHYASLTVDKLGPGFSSMNITAIWGESEGSANNAIFLTTYWLFDTTPMDGRLCTIQANVHLTTPFVGFEHQSFVFNMTNTLALENTETVWSQGVTRAIDVSTKWQDQFISSEFKQVTKIMTFMEEGQIHATGLLYANLYSSLDAVENVNVKIDLQEKRNYASVDGREEISCVIDAAYNKWAVFAFNSSYTPGNLLLSADVFNKKTDEIILSGELSFVGSSILVRTTLPFNKKILLTCQYDWPVKFVASLTTPYQGFEEAVLQYNIRVNDESLDTTLFGRVDKEFLSFFADFAKSQSGYKGELNVTSSSLLPDVALVLEHELRKNKHEIYLKEFATVTLTKNSKLVQSGRALLSFADQLTSISSRTKSLQTVLELPGHSSSSNYTYQSQVRLTGVEVNHYLVHLWNRDRTEVSLAYEGFSSINGLWKKNNNKKLELSFKNSGNGNYRTDLSLLDGYFLKHRLFYTGLLTWDNFLTVSSPYRKVILKNVQTMNSENTNFAHKSTISVDKEVAYFDVAVNFDQNTHRVDSVLFSTTTPWTHPVMAKYDLLMNTGATTKHQVYIKYKENQEITAESDLTSTDLLHSASFNVQSPYCSHLSGSLHLETDDNNPKANAVLKMNEKSLTAEMELVRRFESPSFSMGLNSSSENILQVFCAYDIASAVKEVKLFTSYLDQKLNVQSSFSMRENSLSAVFLADTSISGWEKVKLDFDSALSQNEYKFVLNNVINEKYCILSGTGKFESDSLRSSLSLEHILTGELKRKSVFFEYSKARGNWIVSFDYKRNEISLANLHIKYLKEVQGINQITYVVSCKALMPFESAQNSLVNLNINQNDEKQQISVTITVNDWKATITGENTFDLQGTGHLDLKLSAFQHEAQLYLKHISGDKDTYSWHLSSKHDFISGSVTISKEGESLQAEYDLSSSVAEMKSVHGILTATAKSELFHFESSSNVNNIYYTLTYAVNYVSEASRKHNLFLSVPIEGFRSIKGSLEYTINDYGLTNLKGEITDGNTHNKIVYLINRENLLFKADIDLPTVLRLSAENTGSVMKVAAETSRETLPYFSLNLNLDKIGSVLFETDSDRLGKVKLSVDFIPLHHIPHTRTTNKRIMEISISTDINGFNSQTAFEFGDQFAKVEFTSNITNWREVSVYLGTIDKQNHKYSCSVSKEREQIFDLTLEGFYDKIKGGGLFTVVLQKFYMDAKVKYDFSSNFSVDLKYNVNGNKQHAEGSMSFLPYNTRIDLSTPIKGFEDMTLIGSLNRKDKKAGLVFQRNGKIMEVELSATVESRLMVIKGTVVNGLDEYTVSIGAQNGTKDETSTVYIHAFKNKMSVFWLSLEGTYNLQKTAGLKLSFTSVYYNQLYFEILSQKEESKRTYLFNYLYGIDIAYSLNTTVVGDISMPQLVVDLQCGSHVSSVEVSYDTVNPIKTVAIAFKLNKEKFIKVDGELYVSILASKVRFDVENNNLLSIIETFQISGEYNFEHGSSVVASFVMNNVKHFNLVLKSNSLYNVQFYSSLDSSNYINANYDIALVYTLALPSSGIFSTVKLNGDYYQCTANLTWTEGLAETFFHLNTSAGYGFQNAVLSAKYSALDRGKYSHFIDFFVDDSTLFRLSSDISYPNQMSLSLILPDSLFLPFVKEIGVGFNFTEQVKSAAFKYQAKSSSKRNLNLYINVQDGKCAVNLDRSEMSDEGNLQLDKFKFVYNVDQDVILFKTSLAWENNNIFSVSYEWQNLSHTASTRLSLLQMIFALENSHIWNVTGAYSRIFEFAGVCSPFEAALSMKHPSTVYHNTGLTELMFSKAIDEETYLQLHYKSSDLTEFDFKYTDILKKFYQLVGDEAKYTLFTNMKMNVNNKIVSTNHVDECEKIGFIGYSPNCVKMRHQSIWTGLSEKQQRVDYTLDLTEGELEGTISTEKEDYSFSGQFKRHPVLLCSSVNFAFKNLSAPDNPFALKYETNCLNKLYTSLNVFEDSSHELSADIDYADSKITGIKVQANNVPVNWYIRGERLVGLMTLNVSLDRNSANVVLLKTGNMSSLTVESSSSKLKKLEIINEIDKINRKLLYSFKVDGLKSAKWIYTLQHTNDHLITCHIVSDQNIQVDVTLDVSDKREMFVKLYNNGKLYEGKGQLHYNSDSQQVTTDGSFSLDGKPYSYYFRKSLTSGIYRLDAKLNTPTDSHYIELALDKSPQSNKRSMTVKYKTPFYPLDYGHIDIEYDHTQAHSQDEISLIELDPTNGTREIYNTDYSVIQIVTSVKTNIINVEKAELNLSYGNKYGLHLSHMLKHISVDICPYKNKFSYAFLGSLRVSGFDETVSRFLAGETVVRCYRNNINYNTFASLRTPPTGSVVFTVKNKDFEGAEKGVCFHHTSQLYLNEKPVYKIVASKNFNREYQGDIFGEWERQIVNIKYHVYDKNVVVEMKLKKENQVIADTHLHLYETVSNGTWVARSIELHIVKLLSLPTFNPHIVIKRDTTELTVVQYELYFNNGFQDKDLFFSGNCSLSFPQLKSFSKDSKPSIHTDILLESSSRQYAAIADLLFEHNKMDGSIKWRRVMRSDTYQQDKEYMTLKFGGFVLNNSAELYLNENKFSGFIESSSSQTTVSAHLFNDNLKRNFTIFASVQYTPIFLLTISHTVFDSPCSVEVKVDRRSQSIESAVTINYNHLTQQAIVNLYLDGNPQYAELIYNDIWKQTHEASVYVEGKDNEVTFRCKINSPALYENFLIVTVGSNNDKFEINMSDVFIFKAYKDNTFGLLNLIFMGDNYKMQFDFENELELRLESPIGHGAMTFSSQMNRYSFARVLFDSELYHFLLEINKDNVLTLTLLKEEQNLLGTTLDIVNNSEIFQLQFQCNIFDKKNGLSIRHVHNPILLVISLNSSLFLTDNLDIIFGMQTEDLITGVFEVKQKTLLFKSYLGLSKINRTVEIVIEAPLFSSMDKATVKGVFNVFDRSYFELKLSAVLSSVDTLLSEGSAYVVSSSEMFTSGLVVKRKDHENLEVSLYLPLKILPETKANLIVHLSTSQHYDIAFTWILKDNIFELFTRWKDQIISFRYNIEDTTSYQELHELNIQYLATTLQISAWMKPKYPITDYIYSIQWNGQCVVAVSHALVLQSNHFKSKLIVESAFKGHEKYGIDLELKNLTSGKIIRLLGNVPQLGTDLGIDFGFSYESFLNCTLLAQIRIPYSNRVKMAQVHFLHKIHPSFNFSKLNYSLEYPDLGAVGLEVEVYGSAPFIWVGQTSAIESKLNLNNKIYMLKAKSSLQPMKIQVDLGLETPFEVLKRGEFHLSGIRQLVGSEIVLSINSNELINLNITEDTQKVKEIRVLSKWRNVLLKYKYDVDNEVSVTGYLCWDLFKRDTSQFGVSVKTELYDQKYETAAELLLPSALISKLGVKTVFEKNVNKIFSSIQLDFPELSLEGKLASEIATPIYKSGLQLKWTVGGSESKNIGMFYVKENNEEEIKHYFTLQHFALPHDLMFTAYARSTLYGINMQYSPFKEEEISMELGYWMIEEGGKERSGVKVVTIHRASNTLIYGVVNMTSSSDISEAGLSVAYLTDEDVNNAKYVAVYGKKNKKTPEVFLGLTSNGNSLGLGGSLWTKENYLRGLTVEAKVNQKDPFKLEVVQNLADPGVEAELSYSLSRTYRVFAGMPNNNELTAKLSHTMYGKPNLDALASLRLNTSRILWGRFELPPMTQVGQEFYNGILEEYSDITLVSQAILAGYSDFLHEDFSKKLVTFLNEASTQVDVLVFQTYLESGVIRESIEALGNNAQRAYVEDHLYVKTCFQFFKRTGSTLYNYMSCALEVVFNVTKIVFGPIFEIARRVWEIVEPVMSQWKVFITEMGVGGESPLKQLTGMLRDYQTLRQSLVQYSKRSLDTVRVKLDLLQQRSVDLLTEAELAINQLIRSTELTLTSYLQRVINYKDTILAGFSVLGDTIQGMVEIVIDGIYRIREVRYTLDRLQEWADIINSWCRTFHLDTYLMEIHKFVDRVVHLIVSDIEKNFGEYEVYVIRAMQVLEGHYEEVSRIPQVHYVKNVVTQIYQKVKWFWSYGKVNERLRSAVKQYFENLKATLDELEKQLDQKEGELRSEYIYNAENNSLTFTQELPFEWRAFNQLPEYKVDPNSKPLTFPAEEYSNMVHTMANYLWQDAKLLPYLLPPLGADALITGDSLITFDNTFYNFHGDCGSYLLSSDLYHNTFSLLVDYEDKNKRDLLLITKDLEILVTNNLEVHVNGKLEDLPLKLNNGKTLTVERKVHSVLIKSEEGFSLECSSFQDMCKFHLDQWYIGKTAGLLGTYNNEASDDFSNPNRQLSETIIDFIDSWAVDDKSCENKEDSVYSYGDSRHQEMCEVFFLSQSSPFFPCFHVVDPKSFSEMCLSKASHEGTCSAVMAYLTKCTSAGVQLWMPEFCVDSSIPEAIQQSEYSDIIEVPVKKSADVVFIFEVKDCSYDLDSDFAVLVTNLNSDLQSMGLTDNQFALVSFGSEGAQLHTINGSIWTDDEKQLTAKHIGCQETSEGPSLYKSALELAADLPYRPGATKSVILLHSSDCSHSESYGGVLERFTRSDITLHVLQKAHLAGRKGKGVSRAIGLEKSGAYPRKRLYRNIQPDPELLKQVSAPQDLCTLIVLGTNGTLFEQDVTRKGVRAWTGRVASGAVSTSAWQQCENSVGQDNVPMWRCTRSHSLKLKNWDLLALHEYMDSSRGEEVFTEYEEEER